jgi:hypothetical protein
MVASTSLVRRAARFGASTAVALVVFGGMFGPAAGAATTTTITAPSGTAPPGVEVLNGITVGPATITAPGKPTRTLTASQDTAFLQSWLPTSIVQKLGHVPRPTGVTIYTLHMNITAQGTTSPIEALYATDAHNVYVGMPAQSLGFADVAKEVWILSPEPADTIKAFEGKLEGSVVQAPTSASAATTTTTTATSSTHSSGSGSSSTTWVWFVILGVVVVGGGGFLAVRSRSRTA